MEFSVDEKRRIAERVADPESLQYQILATKLTTVRSHDFWRIAQRKFKITGFREGFPKAREIILERALKLFREIDAVEDSRLWILYRASFEEYVRDLPQLSSLLASEILPENTVSITENVFAALFRAAPVYRVSEKEILDLYEIWCFQRTPDIRSLLNQPIDVEIVRKIIARETEVLRQLLDKMSNDINEKQAHSISSVQRDCKKLTEDLRSLESQLNSSINTVRTESANQIASIVSKNADLVREALKKTVVRQPAAEKNNHSSDEIIGLQRRLHELSSKISAFERKIQVSIVTDAATTAQPVQGAPVSTGVLIEFQKHLKKQLGDSWNDTTFSLLLSTVLSSSVLITDDIRPFEFLFSKLGGHSVRHLGVNPLWTSFEQWKDSLIFISEASDRPRFLVLSDFDSALQELYLVPKLLEWIANPASRRNRIVLALSEPKLDFISKRVLELSIPIQFTNDVLIEMRSIAGDVEPTKLSSIATDADLGKLFEGIGGTDPKFEANLRTLLENDGLNVPSTLAGIFTKLVATLGRFFHPDLAPRIAIQLLIHPWICKVRGAHAGRMLDERMRTIFGV
jgi:hypothetical protein